MNHYKKKNTYLASYHIQKMNSYQTLNSKLNIDEPLKAIQDIDFRCFFILFLD